MSLGKTHWPDSNKSNTRTNTGIQKFCVYKKKKKIQYSPG